MGSTDIHTESKPYTRGPALRMIGLGLLVSVAMGFIGLALWRYLPLDPTRSLVELGPVGFPLLVAHVVFGSIAMLTACLQIWPRFRTRSPAAHRIAGRIYVFAGVVPAGALALVVACLSPFGPVARASNLVFACVWLTATLTGWRAGRRGRTATHRRWMIRSAVLTFSILTNRLWGPLAYVLLAPQLATTFHGDETFFAWTIAGLSTWLGWTLPLLVTQWILEREVDRDRRVSTWDTTRPGSPPRPPRPLIEIR